MYNHLSQIPSLLLDQTKPVTELVMAGTTNNGWYTSNVVTLNATDDLSGVEKIGYKLSENGDWTDYSGSFPLPQDGTYTKQYRSADRAGNVEDARQQTVKVDTTLPSFTLMINGNELMEGESFDDNLSLTFRYPIICQV